MKKLTTALSLLFIVVLTGCTVGANNPDLPPSSIAVTPADPSIAVSTTQQFTATGTYSDGTTKDITSSVTWTVSDPSVTFSSTTSGLATGTVAGGPFTISATLGLISGSTTLTVTPATLVSIAVTPANPTVPIDLTQQFTATGTYSDGTTQNITSSVTWMSSDVSKATINATSGLATAIASSGTTTITATDPSSSISGSTTLTVTSAVLVSIAVTPTNSFFAANGGRQQFTATGTYSDGATSDITSSVTWTSDDTNVTFGVGNGLATCNDTGAVSGITITATDPGTSISGSTSIDALVLSSISITSAGGATSIYVGDTLQFTAIGTYSDGHTQDITSSFFNVWHSSSLTHATISSSGLATGVAAGSSNITASYVGVMSNMINLTVAVSSDATLKTSSTVKGRTVIGLGTPSANLSTITTPGSSQITTEKSVNTSNTGTFITLFDTTSSSATKKVVKYATGVDPTATFATDTPYNNQAITDQDFFIIRVTAQDATTILYYKIVVTVLPTYSLAAAGPSGGWIFYINANYATDGWRYLEAGALSTQTTAYWSNTSHSIGTSSDIGTGQANTTAIVTYLNSIPETGMAAQVCNDLSVTNGAFTYNDWFLPALSEVGQMYANIKVVGGFTTDPNTFYWSSTENGPSNVLLVNFNNGTQPTASKSFGPLRFRCARAF